ncbi:hedgehog receptor [Cichlidogyrus casuarinus]|uniref:Hedgehog receptor n=1 Tax=Cichlidogyrus casuarinus TaxID=1844966 RepID=A0ABD2Q9D2_9PLAT
MKTPSTCSNQGHDEYTDPRGSRSSLGPNSREHSDAEDCSNGIGWRRVVPNRGRGGYTRSRFPSGSAQNGEEQGFTRTNDWNQQNPPLWRQRTTSGSERQSGRGFMRGGHSNNDFYKARGNGRGNRGFVGRGRGQFRNSYTEQEGEQVNGTGDGMQNSYHPSTEEKFFDDDDWVDAEEKAPQSLKQPEKPIWIYIDPQDKVQGPFTSNAMSQWFELNYLPQNLQLRRITEANFTTLEKLRAELGLTNPFVEEKLQPPIPEPEVKIEQPMALFSKFSPEEVEKYFMGFAQKEYSHLGEPRAITESLLKLGASDVMSCLSDASFLRATIEKYNQPKQPEPIDPTGDWQMVKPCKTVKKCTMNEGTGGFHFEIQPISVTEPIVQHQEEEEVVEDEQQRQQEDLVSQMKEVKLKEPQKEIPKKKKKKAVPEPVQDIEDSVQESAWISVSKSAKPVVDTAPTKKKKKTKKDTDAKSSAWEAEMERRKKEQLAKRETLEAEEAAYNQMLAEQERQEREEREAEARSAIHALERREKRWQQTNLVLETGLTAQPPRPMAPPPAKSFAQIQAEQYAEEAAAAARQVKGDKTASVTLNKPTGWASIAAVNTGVVPASLKKTVTPAPKKVTPVAAPQQIQQQQQQPPSIWNLDGGNTTAAGKKKRTKGQNGHAMKGGMEQLRTWCQNQLSNLPAINSAIDLPTVTSLVCDMENEAQVKDFMETSFGNSKKVKQFTNDFIQKKSKVSF